MTEIKTLLQEGAPREEITFDVAALTERGDALRLRRSAGRTALAAVIAVLLGAGAFAAVQSDPKDPIDVLAAAGSGATEAGSARLEVIARMVFGEEEATTRTEGVIDFRSGDGQFTVVNGDITTRIIIDRATTFVEVPPSFQDRTDGRPWLAHPTDDGRADVIDITDPTTILDELRKATDVERVGDEEVNGFDTTRYRASTATASTGEQVPVERFEVWITDDGLPTKVDVSFSFLTLRYGFEMNFTDFGVDVPEATIPAPSDVFEGDPSLPDEWLMPKPNADALGGAMCDLMPDLAESLERQAATMNETQIAEFEKSIAGLEQQLATNDTSTTEGAEQHASLVVMIARFRAIATAARTGEPIDPATIPLMPAEAEAFDC